MFRNGICRHRAARAFKLLAAPALCAAAVTAVAIPQAQAAQSVASFYKGKDVVMLIGYGPGASYDSYGRLVARHLGAFIPGHPTVVPQNKPGSGSLVATNYLYNVAPRDGSVIAVVGQSVYFMQLLERPKIKFDARKLNWIGRMTDVNSLVVLWHKSKAKTIADLQNVTVPIAVGGTLSGSTLFISFMNKLTGTKFQPIKGYRAASAILAMERGEVDGTASITWMGMQANHSDWLRDKKVSIVVQVALHKGKGLDNVPLLTDLATNDTDRRIFQALSSTNAIGRALTAPPGLPADRCHGQGEVVSGGGEADQASDPPDVGREASKGRARGWRPDPGNDRHHEEDRGHQAPQPEKEEEISASSASATRFLASHHQGGGWSRFGRLSFCRNGRHCPTVAFPARSRRGGAAAGPAIGIFRFIISAK